MRLFRFTNPAQVVEQNRLAAGLNRSKAVRLENVQSQ